MGRRVVDLQGGRPPTDIDAELRPGKWLLEDAHTRIGTGKSLLIETHSEHIMLRLLRRIREKSEGEQPPGVRGLILGDLSVVYVEGSNDGVRFVLLRVAEDGDFLDRWPKGFVEERAEELF